MDFAHTEIWQHDPSGELYLVRVNSDGDVVGACGPVTRDEAEYTVNEAGGFFNEESETAEWVSENKDSFRLK